MENGTGEGSQGVPRDSWTAPGRNIAPRYLQDAPRRPPGEGLELFSFEFGRQHGPNLGPKMEPKSFKNRCQNRCKKSMRLGPPFLSMFLNLGNQPGSKMEASWGSKTRRCRKSRKCKKSTLAAARARFSKFN